MALEFAHGALAITTGGVGTTFTVSGLSFQPKALRFYWVGINAVSDSNSAAAEGRRGMGFATSTSSRRCIATFSDDAATTSDCGGAAFDNCVMATITGSATADGRIDLNAINSDGFQLIVDDALPTGLTLFWEAWGGDDITNVTIGDITEPAATGTQNYTATGFANVEDGSQVVMIAGCQSTAALNSVAATDSGFEVGFSTGTAAANNVQVLGNADDGTASMDTDGFCRSGSCLGMVLVGGGTTPVSNAAVSAFGTDQFTLNWGARNLTGRRLVYMAIKGGAWAAGEYTIAGNSGGATATVSGLSFTPIGLCLIGRMTVESASGSNDRIGLGSGTSTSDRRSMGYLDEDATASSACEIDLTVQYDQVLSFPSTGGALQSAYDINAMNSDGFQIIVDTAGGTASEWQGYLTFGDGPSGTTVAAPTRSHTYSPQAPQVQSRVQPGAVTHTYTAQVPSLTVATNVRPDPVAHAYTAIAPQARASVAPAALNHEYMAQTPSFVHTMHVPERWHSYLALAPQARASVGSPLAAHAYTASAPQVQSSVQPDSIAHSYTAIAPQTQVGASVQPGTAAHSYATQSPQVQASVEPAAVVHSYNGLLPDVSAGGSVLAASATHSYNALAPQVNASVMPGAAVHTYSGAIPSAVVSITVQAPAVVHTYTAVVPDVQATPAAIAKPAFGRRFPGGYRPVEFKPNQREQPLEREVEVVEPVPEPVHYEVPGRMFSIAEMGADHALEAAALALIVGPNASSSAIGDLHAVEIPRTAAMAIHVEAQAVLRAAVVVESIIEVEVAGESDLFAWERRPVSEQDALDILSKLVNR